MSDHDTKLPVPGVPPLDRAEVARFLREQPPPTVPPRLPDRPVPGLVAASVLGQRVVRRFE